MAQIRCHSALLTDLYELTMAAAYFENNFEAEATFELFVRALPPQRSYLIAAGLQQCLEYLESVRFASEEIEYLKRQSVFASVSDRFFEYLSSFRFSGEVWAMREGTPVFGEEPILRVTAPIIEAQIVETYLLSQISLQTMIASKAARVISAAEGRDVVEFGTRRAHGPAAGVLAARAAYIGGCNGTSNVEAGQRFGIPIFGTLAHSFVMAYEHEEEAFRRFEKLFPQHSVLLVDTYDTIAAVEAIVRLGLHPKSIRLDSGDLLDLSRRARKILDDGGLYSTRIFASGDLDEFAIAELIAAKAPIDAFGVGTALATSKDAPALSGVYKLTDVQTGKGPSLRSKFSNEKVTYPGRKQVFRFSDESGKYRKDVIACETENYPEAVPLLSPVMEHGRRTVPSPKLAEVQNYTREQLNRIPKECRRLDSQQNYPVQFSPTLEKLLRAVRRRVNRSSMPNAAKP